MQGIERMSGKSKHCLLGHTYTNKVSQKSIYYEIDLDPDSRSRFCIITSDSILKCKIIPYLNKVEISF